MHGLDNVVDIQNRVFHANSMFGMSTLLLRCHHTTCVVLRLCLMLQIWNWFDYCIPYEIVPIFGILSSFKKSHQIASSRGSELENSVQNKYIMDVLPDENTLTEINPVGDDLDERIERLKKRELLPADVLLQMCETVFYCVLV